MAPQISPVALDVRAHIFFNAEQKVITFRVGITVQEADDLASRTFQIVANPHTYGLFRSDGVTELLPLTAAIAAVHDHELPPPGAIGLREGEKLILRPSTVRGGSWSA